MSKKVESDIQEVDVEKQPPIKKALQSSNIKTGCWLASSGTRAFSDSMLSPFIPIYGQSLGANSTQIGFIVSITSLLNIMQILWAHIAQKYNVSRLIAIICSYIASIFSFVLLPIKNIYTFASIRGLNSIILSGTLPTTSTLFAERTAPRSWPLWNSLMQGVLVFGTLIGVLIGGVILWKVPKSYSFPVIFIGSGVITILSAALFQLAVPSQKKLESKGRWFHVEEVDLTLSNAFATMRTDKNFVIFIVVNLIFVFGVNLSGPFYIIFNTTHYDLTIFETSLLTVIGLVPQTVLSIITAKLIERVRKKELFILAGVFTSFFPITYMIPSLFGRLTNVFGILCLLWSINGIFWGIINSSMSTLLIDIIHPRRRTLQLAIHNSIASIALFIAPVLGGFIIENTSTIYTLLAMSSVIRFIGALLFIYVKEPIIGGTILRPIRRILPFLIRANAERSITILAAGKQPLPIQESIDNQVAQIERIDNTDSSL